MMEVGGHAGPLWKVSRPGVICNIVSARVQERHNVFHPEIFCKREKCLEGVLEAQVREDEPCFIVT